MADKRILPSINFENNCSDFSGNSMSLDVSTQLKNDNCNQKGELGQSTEINDYMLRNFASCDCNIDDALVTAGENKGLSIKDGYGVADCNIDSDSVLRIGDFKRHYKSDQQLFPRPFLTTPFIQKGEFNPDLESNLISSLLSTKHRQMQNVSEQNVYTPLTPNLANNVQKPTNLIQELNSNSWVRGGIPSRQNIRDEDYFKRSNDSDVVKEILRSKKKYL